MEIPAHEDDDGLGAFDVEEENGCDNHSPDESKIEALSGNFDNEPFENIGFNPIDKSMGLVSSNGS